ncbi:MAG: hypothetical protein AAGF11_09900 [Myxococcota bacterium]
MKNIVKHRMIASRIGLALCALGVSCDEGRPEDDHDRSADCGVEADQLSMVIVDDDLFEEILDWSDPNSGALTSALNAANTKEAMRSADNCAGAGNDPSLDSLQCASSEEQLARRLVEHADKTVGPQCVLIGSKNFDITFDKKAHDGSENTFDDTHKGKGRLDGVIKRISRDGPALSALITGISYEPIRGEEDGDPGYVLSRDSWAEVSVMNVCYDDELNEITNGPAATVRMEAQTYGKITIVNQSDEIKKNGNSVGKGEFVSGTSRYLKDKNNWEFINGTQPTNLALSRIVSTSHWNVNWETAIPALIDIAALINEFAFPEYAALVNEWLRLAPSNPNGGTPVDDPQPKSAGDYVMRSVDSVRKHFVKVGENKGHAGRTHKEGNNRVNDTIVLRPFDQVTYRMESRFQASVTTDEAGPLRRFAQFVSVAMASDFGLFLTAKYDTAECNKLPEPARQACHNTNPTGYYMVGAKTANNIPKKWDDVYKGDYGENFLYSFSHRPKVCGIGSTMATCVEYSQNREDAYSPRDFKELAQDAKETMHRFGVRDNLPSIVNSPVAGMVANIEAAGSSTKKVTIVEGIIEIEPPSRPSPN